MDGDPSRPLNGFKPQYEIQTHLLVVHVYSHSLCLDSSKR